MTDLVLRPIAVGGEKYLVALSAMLPTGVVVCKDAGMVFARASGDESADMGLVRYAILAEQYRRQNGHRLTSSKSP
jgi:hypothetical protein